MIDDLKQYLKENAHNTNLYNEKIALWNNGDINNFHIKVTTEYNKIIDIAKIKASVYAQDPKKLIKTWGEQFLQLEKLYLYSYNQTITYYEGSKDYDNQNAWIIECTNLYNYYKIASGFNRTTIAKFLNALKIIKNDIEIPQVVYYELDLDALNKIKILNTRLEPYFEEISVTPYETHKIQNETFYQLIFRFPSNPLKCIEYDNITDLEKYVTLYIEKEKFSNKNDTKNYFFQLMKKLL